MCSWKNSRLFMETANWPPLWVFQGLWALFVSICYIILVLFCGFFACFWCFLVFFELDFNSNCIQEKMGCSPNADWSEFFCPGKNKLHHGKAPVYETNCFFFDCSWLLVSISSSFHSGPCVVCLDVRWPAFLT